MLAAPTEPTDRFIPKGQTLILSFCHELLDRMDGKLEVQDAISNTRQKLQALTEQYGT